MNNHSLVLLLTTSILGLVGYNLYNKEKRELLPIIEEEKIFTDINIEKLLYEEELEKLAKELVDDIIKDVCDNIKEVEESDTESSTFYDVCSIDSSSSFMNVEVD